MLIELRYPIRYSVCQLILCKMYKKKKLVFVFVLNKQPNKYIGNNIKHSLTRGLLKKIQNQDDPLSFNNERNYHLRRPLPKVELITLFDFCEC